MKVSFDLAIVAAALICVCSLPASAQMQSKTQQKCINTLNKDMAKKAAKQAKVMRKCIKYQAKGLLPSADSCFTNNPAATALATKTCTDETNQCTDAPDFGRTDCATINETTSAETQGLYESVYGAAPIDSAVIACSADRAACSCQDTGANGIAKLYQTALKTYDKCKKTGLKDGSITSSSGLESCLSADPKNKISKKAQKLTASVTKKCGTTADAFNGPCDSLSTGGPLEACLVRETKCAACEVICESDGIDANCDLVDDGISNSTCSSGEIIGF